MSVMGIMVITSYSYFFVKGCGNAEYYLYHYQAYNDEIFDK